MNLVVTLTNPYKIVEVEFQTNVAGIEPKLKTYEYRTRFEFEPGDCAVVEVNGHLKVVTIRNVKAQDQGSYSGMYKWIVDKVDTKAYLEHLKEEVMIEKEEAELERLAIEHRKVQKVKESFSDNPELLERLNKLIERKKAL